MWVGIASYLSVVDSFSEIKALSKWIKRCAYSLLNDESQEEIVSLTKWFFIFKKNRVNAIKRAESFALSGYKTTNNETEENGNNIEEDNIENNKSDSTYVDQKNYDHEIANIFLELDDMDGDQLESFGDMWRQTQYTY